MIPEAKILIRYLYNVESQLISFLTSSSSPEQLVLACKACSARCHVFEDSVARQDQNTCYELDLLLRRRIRHCYSSEDERHRHTKLSSWQYVIPPEKAAVTITSTLHRVKQNEDGWKELERTIDKWSAKKHQLLVKLKYFRSIFR